MKIKSFNLLAFAFLRQSLLMQEANNSLHQISLYEQHCRRSYEIRLIQHNRKHCIAYFLFKNLCPGVIHLTKVKNNRKKSSLFQRSSNFSKCLRKRISAFHQRSLTSMCLLMINYIIKNCMYIKVHFLSFFFIGMFLI